MNAIVFRLKNGSLSESNNRISYYIFCVNVLNCSTRVPFRSTCTSLEYLYFWKTFTSLPLKETFRHHHISALCYGNKLPILSLSEWQVEKPQSTDSDCSYLTKTWVIVWVFLDRIKTTHQCLPVLRGN